MKLYFCVLVMPKHIYISIALLLFAIGAFAQTSNPFDLKWRSKNPAPTIVEKEAKDTQYNAITDINVPVDSTRSDMAGTSLADSGIVSETETSSEDAIRDDVRDNGTAVVKNAPDRTIVDPSTDPVIKTDPESDGSSMDATASGESAPGESESEKSTTLSTTPSAHDDDASAPIEERPRPAGTIGLALFLILFGLALVILTWAVNINRGFIQKIYRAALNENFSALLLREQRFASSQYLYYIVYAVFFLNGGLFLYLMSRYATWDFGHRETPMILFLVFLSLVYVVKHVVTRLLGETFQISKEMRHYNFTIILYNILAGIALMPVNLFLAFGPAGMRMPMIYTGLGIIALMYIMRQFRGVVMGSHLIAKDVFQFFVYLCAIEILPVLVLFKFFPN